MSEYVRLFCEVDVKNVTMEEDWDKDIPGAWKIWER